MNLLSRGERANIFQCFFRVCDLTSTVRRLHAEHSWVQHGELDPTLVKQAFALIESSPFLRDQFGVIRKDHDVTLVPVHLSHLLRSFSDPFPVLESEESSKDRSGGLAVGSASGKGPVCAVNFEVPPKFNVQHLWDNFA